MALELGKIQTLTVKRVKQFGAYLGTAGEDADVLLPSKYVPQGSDTGDRISVFIYRDSEDRLIATTLKPLITLGEPACLEVKDVGKIGAFMDWGLEKDLFLPFKEQTVRPLKGHSYLVALYIDKSDRLCATMKVYDYLKTGGPYRKNDYVNGTVFRISDNYGAFVAVDNKYHGMIRGQDIHRNLNIGDTVRARVVGIREDGKLDLSMSDPVNIQIGEDAAAVMALIDSYSGVLPFTEKASPAVIERELHMSKAEFKRAVGRLYRMKKISLEDGKIRKVTNK